MHHMGPKTNQKIDGITKSDQLIIDKVQHAINIADAMNQCLWLGNEKHETIYVNSVYEKTSGYSLKECLGQQSDFCFDEESKQRIKEHHRLRKKGAGSQYEATMVSKSGKNTPLLISGAPTDSGGTIGIFINMSKVKKLREQKRISDQIIRSSVEAIVILGKNHRIRLWNTGAEKTFGYKEHEVFGKKLANFVVPKELKEENKKITAEIENKKFIRNFETKRLNKNGEKIDVSLSMTKVTGSRGSSKGYLVIYQDITQRKRVNTELQKRFEAIQDAYKELGIQKRQTDYMNEIIDIAISKEGIEKVGKLIVSATCMLTKCDGSILRLLGEKKKTLRLLSCLGVSHKWLDKSKTTIENSLAEDAFRTQRPIIIQDIDSSTKHQGLKLVKAHRFKALILIPLMIEGKPLGTLSMYATDPGKFRLIETEFLENFGKQCSLALYIKKK
jgi:PAS domain S-box-containing protein